MPATAGSVDWYLPAKRGGGYCKRRFATTTRADSDILGLLAADGLTWSEVKAALNFPSAEQVVVVDRFIAEGYGDMPAAQFLAVA